MQTSGLIRKSPRSKRHIIQCAVLYCANVTLIDQLFGITAVLNADSHTLRVLVLLLMLVHVEGD